MKLPSTSFGLLFLSIFLLIGIANLLPGQVASPPNFPHGSGRSYYIWGEFAGVVTSNAAMGMDRHIVTSAHGQFQWPIAVLDPQFNTILGLWPNFASSTALPYAVINKDRKVWLVGSDAAVSRFSVFSEQGTVFTQFKMMGLEVKALVADTSGHVFATYTDGSPGFGLMRFSTGYTPDFQKRIGLNGTLKGAKWGIDQRMYVEVGSQICVLDANGNVLKVIQNAPDRYAVYQDHGLAALSFRHDTAFVVRLDSNLNLWWSKSVKVPPFGLCGFEVTMLEAVAMPGSNDLMVFANGKDFCGMGCNGYQRMQFISALLMDTDGNIDGHQHYRGPSQAETALSSLQSTPFGDALAVELEGDCGFGISHTSESVQLFGGYNIRTTCGGNPLPNGLVANSVPYLPSASLAGLPTTTPFPVTFLPDTLSLFSPGNGPGQGMPQYTCHKPCVTFSAQALGGGNVQFSDEVFGYYTLQYDFGDGTFGSSPDPLHHYASAGPFTAQLVATNSCGADTFSLQVNPCQTAQIAGPTSSCVGSLTTFYENTHIVFDSLRWLVNGTTAATGDTLHWTPTAAGNYAISLIFSSGFCRDTIYSNVNVFSGVPTPGFSVTLGGATATVVNQSINATSQSWNFGDGTIINGPVTTHTYAAPGTYNICQTVSNSCGSSTVCHAVTLVANSNSYYREDVSFLGTTTPMGTASAANGNSLVVGASSQGAFVLLVDTVGTVLWTKTFPTANYQLNDVVDMPNGNFLVVGGTTQAGVAYMTEFWMEVDQAGNVLRHQAVDGGFPYISVNKLRYGGYFLCSRTQSRYVKLDANLQVQWTGYDSFFRGIAGFQAPDSSYWLVARNQFWSDHMWFIRLGQNGAVTSGYNVSMYDYSPASSSYFERDAVQMDCNGNIFYAAAVDYNSQGNWNYSVAIGKFNTQTHACTNMRYDADRGIGGQFPYLRISPSKMVLKPDGNLRLFGSMGISGFNYTDTRDLMILDITASNINPTLAAYGTAPVKDEYLAASLLPSGAYFCAGISNTSLSLHKFRSNTQCQLPTSSLSYSFQPDPTYTSNPATSMGLGNFSFMPYGTLLSWGVNPNPISGTGSIQCVSPCVSSLFAGFTYAVSGNTVTLTSNSSPGANLTWTIPGMSCVTGGSVTVTLPCGSTTISLTSSDGCGSRTASQTITVAGGTINQAAYAPALLSNVTVCTPGLTAISAAPGYGQYLWSNGATTASTTMNAPGTISLIAQQTTNGCFFTDTATATVVPFTVSLGADQVRCPGATATFSIIGGYTSYAWSNGNTSNTITVSTPGNYAVTVTNSAGCIARDTVNLSNFPTPALSIGPNQTICTGSTATFTATSGFASYLWSNGATTNSITVSTAGTFSVTATAANGCTSTASATLTVNTAPAASIGPNQTICSGSTASFTATSGFANYLWSNGATTSSITVSTAGTYSVTATHANGCTSTASATLTVNTAPAASIGPNQTICSGSTATFTATSGFNSYLWSNGATTNSITVSTAGTYSVTATAANGCTSTASATLTVNNAPAVSIGPNQTICSGTTATFTASSGFSSYLWSNGATTNSITVSTAGTYSVTATAANGCTSTASATLTVNTAPAASIGPNQTICPGSTATFTATSGFNSYLWSNGATTNSITVSTAGTYSVTATHANGCTSTASATLTVNTAPAASIGPNQTICSGSTASFTATSGFASYLWSNGATTNSITVSTAGTYSVTATAANGCTSTASATLTVNTAPAASIGPNQTICSGTNATFTATPGFASYLWNTNATTSAITVTVAGTYSVTVTDANGCTATASSSLSVFPANTFSIGPDTSFCPDTTWMISGPGGMTAYLWSNAGTGSSIAAAAAGTYWLQATDANGCVGSDTMSLSLNPDCVWPGDANHDGIADNQDLLAIGYGFGFNGPTSRSKSILVRTARTRLVDGTAEFGKPQAPGL
ncbi:MAG: PKD domain-containing protein [Bacteroidetes bacterium]|nr:PKD domain-containing protein [Bacteroidota bacterium]